MKKILSIIVPEDEFQLITALADKRRKPISVLIREKLGLPVHRPMARRGFGKHKSYYHIFNFGVTREEAEMIRRKANEAGLSMSRYVRSLLLDEEVYHG